MGIRGWGLPLIMRQPLSYSPIPISGPNPQSPFLYNCGAKIFLNEKKNFFKNLDITKKVDGDYKNVMYKHKSTTYKKIIIGPRYFFINLI